VRHLLVVAFAVFVAVGMASPGLGQTSDRESAAVREAARAPNSILGAPIHDEASVRRYARAKGSTVYIMKTIPIYFDLAPKRNIAPDVLVAQAMLETGYGRYGGDSRPWNMAGIKKGGIRGDEPRDFERPATAYEGVRMHVNHMAAYTGKKPIGTPHKRFYDARAAQKSRGYWVTRVSQLGNGIWATDPYYAGKIRNILDGMARY
jgi:flagellum-specific peptidoglycan hydrolase FlgJ